MQIVEGHGWLGSRLKSACFELRAARLRIVRAWHNRLHPPFCPARTGLPHQWTTIAGKSITPLWTARSAAEQKLVEGKVLNLRVAAARMNGSAFDAGEIFSFWTIVGPPWRSRGFVEGRELREGCLIASVGGGLCQLSNALHLAALEAGMEIVERHAHSKIIPGSVAATGRDATVFWNYKDLRFRSTLPFVIEVSLAESDLIVQFRTSQLKPTQGSDGSQPEFTHQPGPAHDCLGCRHCDCIHHIGAEAVRPTTTTSV